MKKHVMLTAIAAAGLAGVASADTVNVVFGGISGNYGKSVDIQLSNGLKFGDGSSYKSGIWAGQLTHIIDGVSEKTYCTELTQWAHSGIFDIVDVEDAPKPGSGMGAEKAAAIYALFNSTNRAQDINTNKEAAAFQAVIWEIVYDYEGSNSDFNISAGSVKISGIDSALFNLFKGYAQSGSTAASVVAISNPNYQDQLRIVPLPSAAGMAGLGLLALSAKRRR